MAGNTINESGFFLILAIGTLTETQLDMLPYGAMQPLLDLQTMLVWTCPSADAVRYRAQQGVPAWRYLFYGGQNYTNPYIDRVGSNYHCSDLPIVFATAEVSTGIADEPYERQASAHMRRAWATFANDPANGLVQELGWPEYRKNGTSGGKSFWMQYFNTIEVMLTEPLQGPVWCSLGYIDRSERAISLQRRQMLSAQQLMR